MLKDLQTTSTSGVPFYISLDETIKLVLTCIDKNLPDFITFYHTQGSPQRENRISELIVVFFHYCNDGIWPFFFDAGIQANEYGRIGYSLPFQISWLW